MEEKDLSNEENGGDTGDVPAEEEVTDDSSPELPQASGFGFGIDPINSKALGTRFRKGAPERGSGLS